MSDHRKHLGRVGAGTIGIALAVLVVGVALAIVLVQVTANVTSDEFIPTTTTTTAPTTTTTAPSNGLEVALVTGGGGSFSNCGSFGSGPLTFSGFSFALNTGTASPTQYLCVKNAGGGGIAAITLSPAIGTSAEEGCSAAEETVDPEGTACGTAGELAGILQFSLERTDSNGIGSTSCFDYSGTPVAPGGSIGLLGSSLGSGGICMYQVDLVFSGAPTDDQKLAASTDTGSYTIDVTASP
jgi:hypothetical protein